MKNVLVFYIWCLIFYFISQSLDPFPAAGVLKATIIYANFHFHFFFLRLLQSISTNTEKHWSIIHNIMFFIFYFLSSLPPSFATPVEPFMKCRISKIQKKKIWGKMENTENFTFSFHLWYFFFCSGKVKNYGFLGNHTERVFFFFLLCAAAVLKLRKFFLPHYFRFTHLARD